MNYETVKNGETYKEVRERKNRQRAALVNYLNSKWYYANNTSYNKQFRHYKLFEMINEITYYLHVDNGSHYVISHDENFILLRLIRAVAEFTGEKSPAIKKDINKRLRDLKKLISE